MDFKSPGNLIYVIGQTAEELGGSIYYDTYGELGTGVPEVNTTKASKTFRAVAAAIKKGLIASAHDCSDGGIAVALAEMAFSGGLGVTAQLDRVRCEGELSDERILFSESNTRFIVEVDPKKQKQFEKALKGVAISQFGRVEESSEFIVYGSKGKPVINMYCDQIKEAWQAPLRW